MISAPRPGLHTQTPACTTRPQTGNLPWFAGLFEGQTTVAVGVRERLPLRVLVTTERGYRRVALDIAH